MRIQQSLSEYQNLCKIGLSISSPSAAGGRQEGYTYKRVLSESVHGVIQAGEIADLDSNVIENYEKVTQILIIS